MRPLEIRVAAVECHRVAAAESYGEAFGRKLEPALGPRGRGVALLKTGLALSGAAVALDGKEQVWLAGYHLDGPLLANIRLRDTLRGVNPLRGLWSLGLLFLLDRQLTRTGC
jgi:hypothetical protein